MKDLFDDDDDLFGGEQGEAEDLFPEFNPPTPKKEEKDEIQEESSVQSED